MYVAPAGAGTSAPALPQPAVVTGARSTADAIAQAVGSRTVVQLDAAADPSPLPAGSPPGAQQANIVRPIHGHGGQQGWTFVTIPYVATPAVLRLYGLSDSDISAGSDILSARTDLQGTQLGTGAKGDFRSVTVQASSSLPNYTSAPNTLITPKAMTANGLTSDPVGWLVQSKQALTTSQIADAQHRAAAAGLTIEARTGPDHTLQRLRDYATLVGILVALGVLAMTVGLIRSETAGDLRTLTAAGASGATRRTLNAASAGALALLAGLLGTAAAYLALVAGHWHHVSYLNHPPYASLAALVVGLPAVAVVAAWLLGRTPATIARRPLE